MGIACGEREPSSTLLDAIDQKNAVLVQQHIDFGTNINLSFIPSGIPFEGASALHLAVIKNNIEILNLLLINGAATEVKSRDAFGGTPLHWAAYWGLKDETLALVEAGANIQATDRLGSTPRDLAGSFNPFVPTRDLNTFTKDRAWIKHFLSR